jgi:sterol 3beta-glucosyltransferase
MRPASDLPRYRPCILRTGLTDRLGELVHTGSYTSRADEMGAAARAENGLAAGMQVLEQIADVAAVDK